MQAQGCRPDVVTFTALISAFEKGGQWRLALQVRVGVGVGGKEGGRVSGWQGGQRRMLLRQALASPPPSHTHLAPPRPPHTPQAYDRMRAQGCRADAIVFNAIIDTLWETGVVWAQRRALRLFRWVGRLGRQGGRVGGCVWVRG